MVSIAFTVGRFNPLTKGHVKLINHLITYKAQVDKLFIFIVDGEKSFLDKRKNPLTSDYRKKIIKKFFPDICIDIIISPYHIFDILEVQNMKAKFWIAGSDRIESYQKLLDHVQSDCEIISVDRNKGVTKDISATLARQLARDNDFKEFKKILPNCDDEFIFDIMKEIINAG